MALFLFKPHVEGPEGRITTPDVIVDRLLIDGEPRPTWLLTCETYLQLADDESFTPAYAITAIGGGALIGPALVLGSGQICVARRAWRLRDLIEHSDVLTLNGRGLSDIGLPATLIAASDGSDDALPRGIMTLQTAQAGEQLMCELQDPERKRALTLDIVAEPLDAERWSGVGGRPRPRYAVGPTGKQIEHYI